MIHPILVIALMSIVVVILLRITMRTPVVSGLLEKFTSGSLLNSTTECPTGYTMYMYEGGAFCCKGRVNRDATKLERTCISLSTEKNTLCSLGAQTGSVPNCASIQKKVLQKAGESACPPSMPNFCKDPDTKTGRCCTSPVNEKGTGCIRQEGSCTVGEGKNEFLDPTDCRFLRLKEMDSSCPPGYHQTLSSVSNTQSPLHGLSLYGCTNLANNCYTPQITQRLRALGYDVSQLVQC